MKPFLFLGTRAEDDVADSEYAAVLRYSGLDEPDVRRVRLERDPLGDVDLDDWSGIILGGGPFNASDPEEIKSPAQIEKALRVRKIDPKVVNPLTEAPVTGVSLVPSSHPAPAVLTAPGTAFPPVTD